MGANKLKKERKEGTKSEFNEEIRRSQVVSKVTATQTNTLFPSFVACEHRSTKYNKIYKL